MKKKNVNISKNPKLPKFDTLGMLALGAKGIQAWRRMRDNNEKNHDEK